MMSACEQSDASATGIQIHDPDTGAALRFSCTDAATQSGLWSNGPADVWPQVDGIPFVNAYFREAADKAVSLIESGDVLAARAVLLALADEFAPEQPNSDAALWIAETFAKTPERLRARELMERLSFGPVADYFAVRPSSPTYFSGVGLLRAGLDAESTVVEIACGVGHFLYWLERRDRRTVGVDTVFAKLWLARHFFLGLQAQLVCADVARGQHLALDLTDTNVSVFCHDAFYFFPDKPKVAQRMESLQRGTGTILIGHAHLADFEHRGVRGNNLSAREYAGLWSAPPECFDDAAMARAGLAGESPTPEAPETLDQREAMVLILRSDQTSAPSRLSLPLAWPADEPLAISPAVQWNARTGRTATCWPSAALMREYGACEFLTTEDLAVALDELPAPARDVSSNIPAGVAVPLTFVRAGVRPLRWGIIGGGWIAKDYAIPAIQASAWADLRSVAEISATRRTEFQTLADSGVSIVAEAHEVFACADIDAVYIATPNHSHRVLVEQAAAAGKHILCEKPLATSAADLQAMADAARRANVQLITAYDQRFHPAHAALRRKICSGEMGTVTQARIHYACWLPREWTSSNAQAPNWRIEPALAGGGAGIDLLPHGIDLLAWLLDQNLESIRIESQHLVHDYAIRPAKVDDGSVALLRFSGGTVATIHVGYHCPDHFPRRQLEVIGTAAYGHAANTLGQDAGGTLRIINAQGDHMRQFPDDLLRAPFFRQFDSISRRLVTGAPLDFSLDREVAQTSLLLTALSSDS